MSTDSAVDRWTAALQATTFYWARKGKRGKFHLLQPTVFPAGEDTAFSGYRQAALAKQLTSNCNRCDAFDEFLSLRVFEEVPVKCCLSCAYVWLAMHDSIQCPLVVHGLAVPLVERPLWDLAGDLVISILLRGSVAANLQTPEQLRRQMFMVLRDHLPMLRALPPDAVQPRARKIELDTWQQSPVEVQP